MGIKRRRGEEIVGKRSSQNYVRLKCMSGKGWRVLMRSGRFRLLSRHFIGGPSPFCKPQV